MSQPTPPRNRLRKAAKLSEAQSVQLAYGFCAGISVKAIAASSGVTTKTARAEYIALRPLLLRPAFNKWHGLKRALLTVSDSETEALIKASFIDELAACHLNTTCYRNFRLGNRKARQCRTCPLEGKFAARESTAAAIGVADEVTRFYARLGIRGESKADPLRLFRQRLAHTTAVTWALAHSKRLPTGLPSPVDDGEYSVGQLLDRLLSEDF
eukprot:g231.t1